MRPQQLSLFASILPHRPPHITNLQSRISFASFTLISNISKNKSCPYTRSSSPNATAIKFLASNPTNTARDVRRYKHSSIGWSVRPSARSSTRPSACSLKCRFVPGGRKWSNWRHALSVASIRSLSWYANSKRNNSNDLVNNSLKQQRQQHTHFSSVSRRMLLLIL